MLHTMKMPIMYKFCFRPKNWAQNFHMYFNVFFTHFVLDLELHQLQNNVADQAILMNLEYTYICKLYCKYLLKRKTRGGILNFIIVEKHTNDGFSQFLNLQ